MYIVDVCVYIAVTVDISMIVDADGKHVGSRMHVLCLFLFFFFVCVLFLYMLPYIIGVYYQYCVVYECCCIC